VGESAPSRAPSARRRHRRGSLERPVNGRMYRGTWLLVGVPLLVVDFSVGRPQALPPPVLPPTFDGETAKALATELASLHPDRSPGSAGALRAERWVSRRLALYGFTTRTREFEATIPGVGRRRLRNLIAVAGEPGASAIVVAAHRDNTGEGPGANDNASGTAALIELARTYARSTPRSGGASGSVRPAHAIVFLSSDGGAFGNLGNAQFAADPAYRDRIAAVINLDALAGSGSPRLAFTGDTPRSPTPTLVQTAAERIVEQTGEEPGRPSALAQLVDLGFPFSLYGQAPFVARRVPAVTLTTAGDRPPPSFGDSADRLNVRRLEALGRSAQSLLGSLDQGVELAPGTSSYVYLGPRLVRGWAIQLALVAALLPFLAATVDLFARCRRRRIALAPALRSLRSRLAFWLFTGGVFAIFALLGVWPDGADRPISPESAAAGSWSVPGLLGLAVAAALAWLVARDRLLPRGAVSSGDDLAGYTAALLALGVLALVVIATNAFALVFLLPSLHAWLWLPQVRDRHPALRLGVLAAGLAGPGLLLGSLALRFGLGLDTPWYFAALVAVGYVEPMFVVIGLAWLAAAAQMAALTVKRYAPYPAISERPPRGPLRQVVGRMIDAVRARESRAPNQAARAL
jgi:Peptidase family M28